MTKKDDILSQEGKKMKLNLNKGMTSIDVATRLEHLMRAGEEHDVYEWAEEITSFYLEKLSDVAMPIKESLLPFYLAALKITAKGVGSQDKDVEELAEMIFKNSSFACIQIKQRRKENE